MNFSASIFIRHPAKAETKPINSAFIRFKMQKMTSKNLILLKRLFCLVFLRLGKLFIFDFCKNPIE